MDNKKKSSTVCIAVVAVAGIGIGAYALNKDDGFKFSSDEKVMLEYGKDYETKCSAYLADGKELEGCEVSVDGTLEKEKEYFQVGECTVTLKWNDKEISKGLEVKDTVKPTFEDFKKEVTIQQGTEDVKLEDYFMAKDLSDVKVEVKGDVDFATAGKYNVKVTATDKYDNVSEEETCIVIIATEEENEEVSEPNNKTEVSKQVVTSNNNSSNEGTSSSNNGGSSSNSGSTDNGYSEPDYTPAPAPTPQPDPTPAPAPTPDPVPTPQPPVCSLPNDNMTNNTGQVFYSNNDAKMWARSQIEDDTSQWYGHAYSVIRMGCDGNGNGMYGVKMRNNG